MDESNAELRERVAMLEQALRDADRSVSLMTNLKSDLEVERKNAVALTDEWKRELNAASQWMHRANAAEENLDIALRMLRALLPGDDELNRQGVDWAYSGGRAYISVAGRVVALEGDTSRDPSMGPIWTAADIKTVVEAFVEPIRTFLAQHPKTAK